MSQLCCVKTYRYLEPFGLQRDDQVNQSISQDKEFYIYRYVYLLCALTKL